MSASKPWSMIRALLLACVLSAVSLLILTFLLYRFHCSESQIMFGIHAAYIISCLFAGFFLGRLQKTRRFLWGFLIGCSYFAVLFLLSVLQRQAVPPETGRILTVLGLCAGSGMLGGMIS